MERYLGALLIIALTVFAKTFWQTPAVLGETSPSLTQTLPMNQPITTHSSFTEKLHEETEIILKKVIFEDDPQTEAGEEKILEEGEDGKKTKIFKVTYSKDGKEFERKLVSLETIPAKDKKILRGTKIIWKTLQVQDGEIKYWKKMRVYATHYDSRCKGCDEWTAIGMKAGKGVIAVDPKVIKMRSKVYIPGYGMAIAGDTGGAIKGNIIDLGFEDARTAGWRARFIDIYLMD
ncbi:MAG: hypothetical protein ACD_38C00086G0012 [uncultured bacterium]|uniref:G5 domain-containing protein n=1 Tax=Candidatus Daviesbacteria bacterium GW2011_GWC2_40_12 TaxID=1618431 RepID=A0A0G0QPK8_9BACT|nr:MAG: hypothetical protein ACD_38C00086G0012 [uncultured bacterium]KKQ83890.1 MAG: hypothetical protein UT04_C0023G0002 [Candidatus Daviesbacteria bacterium GW2011_GWF2_38_7]KKR16989.1 MAG: hypothetical protein UT45_C0003G0019 [Candidatus Daviesbacteria bacterium GW2011_GWA2_39_33]KKR25434.1 MAG: hypothetical protein UT54_C0002G0017 [Candidatus Daviesbacteria bacterium GW2011_GWB1_39_5]KKR42053.1 MAG: hypothetical protein UT77_C0004G0037 [Candidatus Daviesbacteria bacterium GW2011_GWC2_40_12]